jgi:hypothetical protein
VGDLTMQISNIMRIYSFEEMTKDVIDNEDRGYINGFDYCIAIADFCNNTPFISSEFTAEAIIRPIYTTTWFFPMVLLKDKFSENTGFALILPVWSLTNPPQETYGYCTKCISFLIHETEIRSYTINAGTEDEEIVTFPLMEYRLFPYLCDANRGIAQTTVTNDGIIENGAYKNYNGPSFNTVTLSLKIIKMKNFVAGAFCIVGPKNNYTMIRNTPLYHRIYDITGVPSLFCLHSSDGYWACLDLVVSLYNKNKTTGFYDYSPQTNGVFYRTQPQLSKGVFQPFILSPIDTLIRNIYLFYGPEPSNESIVEINGKYYFFYIFFNHCGYQNYRDQHFNGLMILLEDEDINYEDEESEVNENG